MKKKQLRTGEEIPKITINYTRPHLDEMYKIKSPLDVVELLRKTLFKDSLDYRETVFALFLTRTNHILGSVHIGSGNLYTTGVDIEEIISVATSVRAFGVILCHNHPSGNLDTSHEDFKITERLKDILSIMNMQLVDHLIITKESYYSYADKGEL